MLRAFLIWQGLPKEKNDVAVQDGNTSLITWMNDIVTYRDFLPMTIEGPDSSRRHREDPLVNASDEEAEIIEGE
jgi:hypothetical protein